MKWLLSAPREYRLWFLRGLADSDGGVHFQEKWVDIATSPNTLFVKRLVDSLGIHTRVRIHRGYGYVSISCKDAAKIQIFNPEIPTHRRKMLEKVVGASIFRSAWPDWLNAKIERLVKNGLGPREICIRLLEEDNVYAKMRTVKRKIDRIMSKESQRGVRTLDLCLIGFGFTKATL